MSEWWEIWANGLPGTVNSPKSAYRTAAEGNPIQRRRNLCTIAMDVEAIWEMSDKGICEDNERKYPQWAGPGLFYDLPYGFEQLFEPTHELGLSHADA